MESIDALAKAVNEFEGGLVLVSHDMRLIGQVAKEIWICNNKRIEKHQGDIQSFKMDMRKQMGIDNEPIKLRGDFSVKQKDGEPKTENATPPLPKAKHAFVAPPAPKTEPVSRPAPPPPLPKPVSDDDDDERTAATSTTSNSLQSSNTIGGASAPAKSKYIPPHLRKKMQEQP